jgi:uncharacterized protein
MRRVFADTYFFIALLNPRDEHHAMAAQYTAEFSGRMVTTAWVLTELANTLAKAHNRSLFLALLNDLRSDPRVTIVPPAQNLFDRGLELYTRRPDKDWSLTDCISFDIMEQERLTEALTADHHFEQAGFAILLKKP